MSAINEKISKLLRLSRSPNPNEAALAMQKAHELMEREGLTLAEVSGGDEFTKSSIASRTTACAWELSLAAIIGDAFGVYVLRNEKKELIDIKYAVRIKKSCEYVIFGKPHRVKYAEYALSLALKAVNKARRKKLANLTKINSKSGRIIRATIIDNFCEGYIYGIHLQLKHLYPAAAPELEAAKTLTKAKYKVKGTRTGKEAGFRVEKALRQGFQAGQEFQIFQPVEGGSTSPVLAIEQ